MARYMMFASVYFHHTTRLFEHILHDALRELWPDPHALDPIEEFLRWDDFRVLDRLSGLHSESSRALRERIRVFGLAAEFNAERDLRVYETCERALRERFGTASVWADEQSQVMHRLPLGAAGGLTVWVSVGGHLVDAREASDLIGKLSGKAYWRKLFVRRDASASRDAQDAMVREAQAVCAEILAKR